MPRIHGKDKTAVNHRQGTTAAQRRALKPTAEPGIGESGCYTGPSTVCLTIFDHRADSTLAGCDIKRAELSALRRKANAAGKPVGYLLRRAVEGMVAA